ncbi:hypothetical protein DVH05_010151 [Phytophthora capsici]|nr:hypothetical protein DVH05_010151 [Phytophthora capsici]
MDATELSQIKSKPFLTTLPIVKASVFNKGKRRATSWPKISKLTTTAFKHDYTGSADFNFQKYLAACCSAYSKNLASYTAPSTTITQSSGFGKSRILKRLSETPTIEHNDEQFGVKVLYICARTIKHSSGYPCATQELREWLFPKNGCSQIQITTALQKAFTYSLDNLDANKKWKRLFELDENNTIDEEKKDELDKVKLPDALGRQGQQDTSVLADTPGQLVKKRKRNPPKKVVITTAATSSVTPVFVVAIDEARSLLTIKNNMGDNAFKLLRRAFKQANFELNAKGMVFAILVDTNS